MNSVESDVFRQIGEKLSPEEVVWIHAMCAGVCRHEPKGDTSAEILARQADLVVKKWRERFGRSGNVISEGSDG